MVCYDQTLDTFIGPGTCASHGGIAPGQPAPAGAIFPASTQAVHAYAQPATYTVTVVVTFSDGTTGTARTTVTVTGAPAALPVTAPQTPPQVLSNSVPLSAGCNSVTLTFANGTPISTVVAAVQGTTVTSIYETPANAPELVYSTDPSQPSNLASVQYGDQASICVTGAGTLNQPPASS
jgi:hypothetical protein